MPDSMEAGRAFTAQSEHYDADDHLNPVIADLRNQVYRHIDLYLTPASRLLEINAGTGIDASRFASRGHTVLATDIADGMMTQIRKKISHNDFGGRLSCRQLSYDQLDRLYGESFDFIYSNFGGLNCIRDLHAVAKHVPDILRPGGMVCLVIMPPVCPWEIVSALKGNRSAFRRWKKNGTRAHIDGHYFTTWYHSLSDVRHAFGARFKLVCCEGLAAVSPPPHRADFPVRHPALYRWLRKTDQRLNRSFPFNRWADHIIVTLRFE